MPAYMSTMTAADSGSITQLQKLAAVAQAAHLAFVIVVGMQTLSNMDEIVCFWLP